jgi:hypothetical protein
VIALLPLIIHSQTQQVYSESFDSSAFETLNLDLENSSILIEKSDDNKIHFDFSVEFKNYPKKEMESLLRNANVSASIENKQLILKTRNENVMSGSVLIVENGFVLERKDDNKAVDTKKYRKTKRDVLSLINVAEEQNLKELLNNLKVNDNGSRKKINIDKAKMIKTNFIIRVPEKLNYLITADNSNLNFNIDINLPVTIKSQNSRFKFKSLSSTLNSIDIKNGKFHASLIQGGNYFFDNVRDVKIVEINTARIKTEFSNLKIGELGSKVEIGDFNSKFWIYNFTEDFRVFKMKLEYSEVNLFYPENKDFSLITSGHTTKHITNSTKFETPPSKESTSSKMFVLGNEMMAYNRIDLYSEHSIIRLGEDYIDVSR